jgi:hypothetical protein
MKLWFINLLLKFKPLRYEYLSCDYYGRRRMAYKTLFGRKYFAEKWEHVDLLRFDSKGRK